MAGNLLQSLADEVEDQPSILQRFAQAKIPKAPGGSIFVGAGDSYAAALLGFYASKGRCIALDPYSLASVPEITEGLHVFFISASGMTSSNLLAAARVKRWAKETTALTARSDSRLAKSVDSVVELPMNYVPKTPGMLSFSLSALAVLKIVGWDCACDFAGMSERAKEERTALTLGKGTTYFLGNSLAYPAALYAAAKTYEFFGAKAHAEQLEEFSHLELFSLRKSDVVNSFSSFDRSGMARKLAHALGKEGYESRVVSSQGASDVERFFHSVFVVQLWALRRSRELGLVRPRFLASGARLGLSDSMIY